MPGRSRDGRRPGTRHPAVASLPIWNRAVVGPDEVADVAEDLADQWVVGESETSTWSRAQPFKSGRRGLLLNPGDVEGDSLLNSSLGRVNTAFIPGRGYIFGRGKAEKYRPPEHRD